MAAGYVAVSAIGRDRVGLVDDIAAWIEGAGGNVEESKMAVLGGEFAVITLVSGSVEVCDKLVQGAAAQAGILNVRLTAVETSAPGTQSGGLVYMIESVSLDSPGLVHALAGEIRSLGISIEELETSSAAAPWTGAPVFRMKARIILPPDLAVSDFREHMDRLGHERNLDLRVEPV